MRCYICDWGPGNEQSDFFLCLPDEDFSAPKNFLTETEDGLTICHNCDCKSQAEEAPSDAQLELWDDLDDEMVP